MCVCLCVVQTKLFLKHNFCCSTDILLIFHIACQLNTFNNMGDSDLSASELRQRYHRGGSLRDDELSAQQLRARHGVPTNKTGKSIQSS